jgi:hypothetical protein
MLASIVKQNADTAQALFLVSAIFFAIAAVFEPQWWRIVCVGLFFTALGLLFFA